MQIRYYRPGDVQEIAELSGQLGYPCTAGAMQGYLQALQDRLEHALFVAEVKDGSIAGWIHVYHTRLIFRQPFAEVGGLVVGEPYRGMGIGKSLVLEAEKWARAAGCDLLRIRSNVKRVGAHDFYEHLGYVVLKTQRVYDKNLSIK